MLWVLTAIGNLFGRAKAAEADVDEAEEAGEGLAKALSDIEAFPRTPKGLAYPDVLADNARLRNECAKLRQEANGLRDIAHNALRRSGMA